METEEKSYIKPLLLFVLFAVVISAAYFLYAYIHLRNELANTKVNLALTETICENKATILEKNIQDLQNELSQTKTDNTGLADMLNAEQEKNTYFEKQINVIGTKIGTLEKLNQTDKELLQKYSKVYFLSENYIPAKLSDIPKEYLYEKTKTLKIHTNVLPFLTKMLDAASSSTSTLEIISGYRPFGEQAALKENYKLTYGYGANKFSADQGYSEHQLATTIDVTTPALGASFSKFDTSPAYTWMNENAHKYGFILSYPKQNTYYQYEPWHWRFVGINLATRLHDINQHFYNLDQREIDGYLLSIFDLK